MSVLGGDVVVGDEPREVERRYEALAARVADEIARVDTPSPLLIESRNAYRQASSAMQQARAVTHADHRAGLSSSRTHTRQSARSSTARGGR